MQHGLGWFQPGMAERIEHLVLYQRALQLEPDQFKRQNGLAPNVSPPRFIPVAETFLAVMTYGQPFGPTKHAFLIIVRARGRSGED